jgi:hypothetical protein
MIDREGVYDQLRQGADNVHQTIIQVPPRDSPQPGGCWFRPVLRFVWVLRFWFGFTFRCVALLSAVYVRLQLLLFLAGGPFLLVKSRYREGRGTRLTAWAPTREESRPSANTLEPHETHPHQTGPRYTHTCQPRRPSNRQPRTTSDHLS